MTKVKKIFMVLTLVVIIPILSVSVWMSGSFQTGNKNNPKNKSPGIDLIPPIFGDGDESIPKEDGGEDDIVMPPVKSPDICLDALNSSIFPSGINEIELLRSFVQDFNTNLKSTGSSNIDVAIDNNNYYFIVEHDNNKYTYGFELIKNLV